jgi:uncharacterized protein (DUF433 family)
MRRHHPETSDDSLLGVGLYSVPQSAKVISHALSGRVEGRLLHRWAQGRREVERNYAPLIGAGRKIDGSDVFTFSELIELLTVAALRLKGVSPNTVRSAYKRLRHLWGDHPFARERFRTDGIGIFPARDDLQLEELSRGQFAIENVVRPILSDVSYVSDRAVEFSPLGLDKSVVLNPARAFGAPINRQTGVPTYVLYSMRDAGESEQEIADWYGVAVDGVRDAIEYETALAQAA